MPKALLCPCCVAGEVVTILHREQPLPFLEMCGAAVGKEGCKMCLVSAPFGVLPFCQVRCLRQVSFF